MVNNLLNFNQTEEEWLKFNYGLSIGCFVKYGTKEALIKQLKLSDGKGHFRTKYPVVIGINSETEYGIKWLTIESIFKY